MAIQRAEDKTAQMQARAGAIDELLASGALEDVSGTPRDDIQVELDRMGAGNDVELELQKLRGEISGGATPELEAGSPGGNSAQAGQAARPAGSAAVASDGASDAQEPARPAIPASDVGESAIPSADTPRAGDGT